ncbi:MAG: transposase [Chloroflexi bacterium]|nr:transposase [Chloroflexota bacterium]
MEFDPKIHHRRSIRLQGYDYSQAGAYFVTIVAWRREMLFGDIVDGEMGLNDFGKIVSEKWRWLETQYEYIELGAWVVMPNHFHGILIIHDVGRGGSRSAPAPAKRKSLGGLIGAFKTVSTKQINLLRNTEGQIVWQRNYYEHIIRNEREMGRITRYIEVNPLRWADDEENSMNIKP